MAGDKKKGLDLHATLGFTDETGYLLAPLVRRSFAPKAHTPLLKLRAKQRDKLSVAAALILSPTRGHISLYFQSYPHEYVDSQLYAHFLRNLLWHVRGPLLLLHDRGNMHKGEPLEELYRDFPRLHTESLPAYAPELNPPEYLWTYTKYHRLANFAPLSVEQIDQTVCREMHCIQHDQPRLRSFFASSPLPWNNTTLII